MSPLGSENTREPAPQAPGTLSNLELQDQNSFLSGNEED